MHRFEYKHPICKPFLAAAVALTLSAATGALAAEMHGGSHGQSGHMDKASGGVSASTEIGRPGMKSEVTQTITIAITDNRYSPENITVKKGETVRFVLNNKGNFVHEFNIGTAKMHKAHQKGMMMMVEHGVLEPDKINHAQMKMDMGVVKPWNTMIRTACSWSRVNQPKSSGHLIRPGSLNSPATCLVITSPGWLAISPSVNRMPGAPLSGACPVIPI
jgi:uncharacterized cupredoxin-like copper-binding protein